MKVSEVFHQFEVPLYVEPSLHFERFMKKILHPLYESSISVKYWRDKLSFTFHTSTGTECSHSVEIFPTDFKDSRKKKLTRHVASFTSKLNCIASLLGTDCEMFIVLATPSEEEKGLFGNDVIKTIRVNVICRNVAKNLAISNFFTVVDTPTIR